ncbi:MAG: restriction endonuclease subunit S, partial [Chloroflexota bacterium]|nr:restriction endonuclease subunit S [Chloroflexota bacterium]
AEQQLAAARALPASYLRAVFESDEAHAWPVAPLGELCDGTGQYGLSDKLSSEPLGIPVLRMGNLRDGGIDWSDLKYLNVSASEVSNYRLHRGDVLFNRTNSAELVGKTALFDGTREAVFASYLIRFMTRNSVLLPEFFTFYMSTQAARRFIADNLTRAIGQVNISASTMSRLSVPIPAIERQQQAVARLREGYERASRLRALVMEQLGATDHLMSAVLRAAFSGKP